MKKVTVPGRLTSPNFPRDEFAACPRSKDYKAGRSKILRWFKNENPTDWKLSFCPSLHDQTFDLRLLSKAPIGVSSVSATPTGPIGERLDQAIVNKIEIAKAAFSRGVFDFVLFEDSPQTEARYRAINL